MAIETKPYDSAEFLDSDEAVAAYMAEALETGDPAFIRDALNVVTRAVGMSRIAREAQVSRESLYRSLGPEGNPEFDTIIRVITSLGLKLTAIPADKKASEVA